MDKNSVEKLPGLILYISSVSGEYQYQKNQHHEAVQAA